MWLSKQFISSISDITILVSNVNDIKCRYVDAFADMISLLVIY